MQHGYRYRCAGGRSRLHRIAGAGAAGDRAAYARAVRTVSGEIIHPRSRPHCRRGARGARVRAMITAITMPKWGLTMTEGKVVHWLKQPGASFAAGDELLEIETSKITNVVEAEGTGSLARIVAPEGSTLPIGALLAVIAPPETQAAEIDAFVSKFVVVAPADAGSEDVAPPAPRELEVLGRTLRCLELGNGGVPALLLHGFGGDLNTWMFNQP